MEQNPMLEQPGCTSQPSPGLNISTLGPHQLPGHSPAQSDFQQVGICRLCMPACLRQDSPVCSAGDGQCGTTLQCHEVKQV